MLSFAREDDETTDSETWGVRKTKVIKLLFDSFV